MLTEVENFARFPHSRSLLIPVNSQDEAIPFDKPGMSFLPFGMGRSFGDCCLNDGNALLTTRNLSRILSFDEESGRLVAEAGVNFDEIQRMSIPQGWFLPVTPGTRFVTVGGAIGNDVHGKNHHCAGTFGHHVLRFELRRSDGSSLICSPQENPDWFRATIGGLGLTGLIIWAEIQMKPIVNSLIDSEVIRYGDVEEFYSLNDESVKKFQYTVAWVDTLSGQGLGRGLFIRGNHNKDPERVEKQATSGTLFTVPFVLPFSILNRATLKIFNTVFYNMRPSRQSKTQPLGPFFYPLDSIGAYHRLYGPGGIIQWQALVPSKEAAREILSFSSKLGGSFLTVMKVMENFGSVGLLSFSGNGVTIALDFPYSRTVIELLPKLDAIVAAAGGRLYPAKDARMSGEYFRQYFPQWQELIPFIDPKFSSSFWRRVTAS
jgi:hypothetical protein